MIWVKEVLTIYMLSIDEYVGHNSRFLEFLKLVKLEYQSSGDLLLPETQGRLAAKGCGDFPGDGTLPCPD